MAQSQVLNVHYLWLQRGVEPSSPEPFHSSHLSLCWVDSDWPLGTTRASRGALNPQSHVP